MTEAFYLGQMLITRGANAAIEDKDIFTALHRHSHSDWGNVCEEDWAQNDWSLANQARLLSSYESSDGVPFWVITEADRSATTVLLPEEY